jgi:hypothetical protein
MDNKLRNRHVKIAPDIKQTPEEYDIVRRKRMIYRSKQRGWLEVDILLGKWATEHVPSLTLSELDEYDAVDRTDAICLGFTPYVTKYGDDYQGHYGYKWTMIIRDEKIIQIDTIRVYCVEFFPKTKKIGAKKEK